MKLFPLLLLLVAAPSFAETTAPLNGVSSSLTLYVYPPRNPIDWRTPESTLGSMLKNLIGLAITHDTLVKFESDFNEQGTISSRYKSSMGHTLAHVSCSLPGGASYDHWASLSGEEFVAEDKRLLLKEKVGMGAMFHNYIDGHIIAGIENVKRITHYKGGRGAEGVRKPRYMQFEVDADHCKRLKDMIDFFEGFHFPEGTSFEELSKRSEENLLYFTNQIDPYDSYLTRIKTGHGLVGGGCAPFGAALLKIAGRYMNEFENYFRTPVYVSEKLIGGQFDPKINAIRRVSLHDILFSPLGKRWTYDNEGYTSRFVNMYDPQKIWDFDGAVMACLARNAKCDQNVMKLIAPYLTVMGVGEQQSFKDVVKKEFKHQLGEGGGDEIETVTEKVDQRVDGIVWRLR